MLLSVLTLVAAAGGAALAQLRGEDACLGAGGRVVSQHSVCAISASEEAPLRAPYASFASLGAMLILAPWAIYRGRERFARPASPPGA